MAKILAWIFIFFRKISRVFRFDWDSVVKVGWPCVMCVMLTLVYHIFSSFSQSKQFRCVPYHVRIEHSKTNNAQQLVDVIGVLFKCIRIIQQFDCCDSIKAVKYYDCHIFEIKFERLTDLLFINDAAHCKMRSKKCEALHHSFCSWLFVQAKYKLKLRISFRAFNVCKTRFQLVLMKWNPFKWEGKVVCIHRNKQCYVKFRSRVKSIFNLWYS